MKKSVFILIVAILCVSLLFAGCAGEESYTKEMAAATGYVEGYSDGIMEAPIADVAEEVILEDSVVEEAVEEELADNGSDSISDTSNGVDVNSEPKLVYTLGITLQTYDFDQDYQKIKNEITKAGGYVENENLYSPDANQTYQSGRSLYMCIRIPSDRYDSFVQTIDGIAYTQNKSSNISNISDTYYDVDSRIELLEERKERLYGHLEETTRMADKIEIENQISDVIYQLDELKGQKRGLDNSVDYATVNLDMTELVIGVGTVSSPQLNPGNAFVSAFFNLGSFICMQLTWLASAAPVLIIVAVALIIIFTVLKKTRGSKNITGMGSLVFGIIGVILSCVFSIAGIAFGVTSFLLGFRKAKESRIALAGYIVGLVAIAIGLILIIIGAVVGAYDSSIYF